MANQALYLRWRPQTFDDVIGQAHVTTTLQNSLRQGRIRHAYLFSGPRGTGKTTTARLLAKAVNCTHDNISQRPCNECHACMAVNEGRFFDLIEIDAASHTGVDDVRDLRDKIAFSPSEGRYKVYIIDEVHRFSGAAFDALLKTLEEPPAHAIFVLATTEFDKVPATIKSRCLLFEFRRVSVREVVERLQMICDDEGIRIETPALELIARQGTGSVRDSISLLDQIIADPDQHITLDIARQLLGAVNSQAVLDVVQAIIEQNTRLALDLLNEAIDRGADPRQFGQQIVEHLRNVMLVQIGGVQLVDASNEMREMFQLQADAVDRRALRKAVGNFNDAIGDLRGGWQPQLPLELAIVDSTQVMPEMPVDIGAAPAKVAERTQPSLPQPAAPAPPATMAEETSSPAEEGIISLQELTQHWSELRNHPEIKRTPLPALLDNCRPLEVSGNLVVIGISNNVLKPKLERQIDLLKQTIEAVFSQRVNVRVDVMRENQTALPAKGHAEDDLEAFGVSEFGAEITELDQ